MTGTNAGIVYDAATTSRFLGLPAAWSEPVPQAAKGEIVVYYGGWDLTQLRLCTAGTKWMSQHMPDWWARQSFKAEPGYYRLILRSPDSCRKAWDELPSSARWHAASVCVVLTALLVRLQETGENFLRRDWFRCAETGPNGVRAVLAFYSGRVSVSDYWDEDRDADMWLANAWKC
jgi:hypothetical protein